MNTYPLPQPCVSCSKNINWSDANYSFYCQDCDVKFSNTRSSGMHIRWDRQIGDWWYYLNLYPDINKTIIMGFHSSILKEGWSRWSHNKYTIELDYCLKNVNSDNCIEKIKFLLTFQ